jgi:hypothetical protein
MMTVQAKDAFWGAVRDCLIDFHGVPPVDADVLCTDLRRKVESPPTGMSADVIYHDEPFDVACDLANRPLSLSHHQAAYDQILAKHNW